MLLRIRIPTFQLSVFGLFSHEGKIVSSLQREQRLVEKNGIVLVSTYDWLIVATSSGDWLEKTGRDRSVGRTTLKFCFINFSLSNNHLNFSL